VSFDSELVLLLAPLVMIAVGALAWTAFRRRLRAAGEWSAALARTAREGGRLGVLLVAAAALFGALALAGPRWGRSTVTAETQSLSVVLAVDISRSMLAEDVEPSRLGRAVREAGRLVQDLRGDRIGLLAFAGRSYILSPLSVDEGAMRLFLDELAPDIASEGGSNLTSVMRQARGLLTATTEVADRVLVVFTDGEGHDSLDDAVAEAEALRAAGIRLVMVGEGGQRGARIPIRDSTGTVVAYKLDDEGRVVVTRRDDARMQAIADAAEGTVIPGDVTDQAGAVRALLSTLKRSPSTETRTADMIPRAWIPVLAAVALLLLQTLLRRSAALIALAGLVLGPAAAGAQRPTTSGERALREGDPERAAQEYLSEVRRGVSRDTAFYNAGTAALRAGRLDVARGALQEAAKSVDPALRYRALYNLGVIGLLEAQQDSAHREATLGQAVEHLRQALLLQPGSERAKWNLELAERRRPPPPSGGGGGGGGNPPPDPSTPQQRSGSPRSSEELGRSQAEQILNSMERQERSTKADQIRRMRGAGGGGVKDW
jgi:Ca-activated chloride channel family protein